MTTPTPPFTIIHPRGSYQNHRANRPGDGLLCGKPLPPRFDVVDIDNDKPHCRVCSRRWDGIRAAADKRLRLAGCRCYYRGIIMTADSAQCDECGIAVPLDGIEKEPQ